MTTPPPDGPHLAFPFHVGPDGRTACIRTLEEHVRDEIVQLLLTGQGERPMLPELGGGVRRLVFQGATDLTAALAKSMISQALARWLGQRVVVDDLRVESANAAITVDLTYRLAGSDEQHRVRFERRGA